MLKLAVLHLFGTPMAFVAADGAAQPALQALKRLSKGFEDLEASGSKERGLPGCLPAAARQQRSLCSHPLSSFLSKITLAISLYHIICYVMLRDIISYYITSYMIYIYICYIGLWLPGCDEASCRTLLAEMHLTGLEVPRDLDQAMQSFQAAADAGDSEAQYALGVLYSNLLEDDPNKLHRHEAINDIIQVTVMLRIRNNETDNHNHEHISYELKRILA